MGSILENKIITIALIFLFASCSPDLPEDGALIKWSTTIEVPVIEDNVTLESLAEDSLISIEKLSDYFEDGEISDSIFVYKKQIEIDKIEVGDKLEIDPISSSFNQSIDDVTVGSIEKNISSEIGTISLNDIEPSNTDPFILSDIYPAISDVTSGTMVAIPSFEIVPIINSFTFEDFEFAEFSQGLLEIDITNNMVIPLGSPLVIELLQITAGDTLNVPGAAVTFEDVIDANNGSASGTIDLSNVSLPGEIFVRVSGNCQGTSGIEIYIDDDAKNSSFFVSIGGSGLEVSATNAKIPQQSIEENGVIELEPDSNKVVNALIQSGQLTIEIDNHMNISSNFEVSIPNLEDQGGNQFVTNIDIAAGALGVIDQTNLTDYSLSMLPDEQSITYEYNVLTLDSGNEFILISSSDSINVKIMMSGLEQGENISFSEFTGYLNQDAMIDSNSIDIETATKVDEAKLSSGQLNLSITNNIGIEALVNFSINEFTKNGVILDTSFSISSDPSLVSVDLEGYTLDLDIDSDPQIVNYVSSIDIPSDELISLTFGQSILIDVNLDSISFSEISGYVDPVIVDIDSIQQELDLPEEIENLDFSIINMDFEFQSSLMLPVFLNLTLSSINDETGESYSRNIDNVNITENPYFSIDSIEQLINIKPDRIIATGNAKVGSLTDFGSVNTTDSLSGTLTIAAPLAFEIDENSAIDMDYEEFEAIENIDELLAAKIFVDYENDLELGASIIVLMATDTNTFFDGRPDTLAELTIKSSQTNVDSLIIDQSSFELLERESNYSKVILNLLGNNEGSTRFLSTDTIKYSIYLSTEIVIDPNEYIK